jgi:hypothetical protein
MIVHDLGKFEASVDKFVRDAIRVREPRCFAELVSALPGVSPLDAVASLARLEHSLPTTAAVLLRSARESRAPAPRVAAGSDPLPTPHPLDYDWRFDGITTRSLLQRIGEQQPIAMIGTPTLAIAADKLRVAGPLLLLDSNESAIRSVASVSSTIRALCIDVESGQLPKFSAASVIVDPPWYEQMTTAFLWAAARLCARGGQVLACFPGLGTRPGIREERKRLIDGAEDAGLLHVRTEAGVIAYVTPPFERSAFLAANIANVPASWRKGDLITFESTGNCSIRRPTPTKVEERWSDVEIRDVRIKVRSASSIEFGDPTLRPLIDGDVLPTISRREPRRALVDVWTSTNRVFACRGRAVLLAILRGIATRRRPATAVAELLGRPLGRSEVNRVAEATAQVRALIRQERADVRRLQHLGELERQPPPSRAKPQSRVRDEVVGAFHVGGLLRKLRAEMQNDTFWNAYFEQESSFGIHLAIFNEPYLRYVLEGTKTIESRFSINRCPPYRRVSRGDLLLLKRAGGPVVGICAVGAVQFYNLDPASWQHIRRDYTTALCAQDPEFWSAREAAAYATLMQVSNPCNIPPFDFPKRDRRGWVVLQNSGAALNLPL